MTTIERISLFQFRDRLIAGCDARLDAEERKAALALWPAASKKRQLVRWGLGLGPARGLWRSADTLPHLPIAQLNQLLQSAGLLDTGTPWLLFWPGRRDRQRLYVRYRKNDDCGLIKVALDKSNRLDLEHEASVLAHWQDKALPFGVPRVLGAYELGHSTWALHLGGWPMDRANRPGEASLLSDREAIEAADQVRTFLFQATEQERRLPVGATDWFDSFVERAPTSAWAEKLKQSSPQEIPVAWAHGDLGPGNMVRYDEGQLFVYDWEGASAQAPLQTDEVACWLALRQRAILRNPQSVRVQLLSNWPNLSQDQLGWILAFLVARENMAAAEILKS